MIVNKKVNTRFFSMHGANDSSKYPVLEPGQRGNSGNLKYGNPCPGTIVSQGIIEAGSYEFYMVSVLSRQGVVAPTHITVIEDTLHADPRMIESLTYKLTYTYFNVSGSIKVPSTLHYANRLANLVGERSKNLK